MNIKSGFWWITFFSSLWAIVAIIFLARWQLQKGNEFYKLAASIGTTVRELQAPRGNIFTLQGEVIATDKKVWDIIISVIYENDIIHLRENISDFLNFLVNINILDNAKKEQLLKEIEKGKYLSYFVISKEIEDYKAAKVRKYLKETRLRGIYLKFRYKRYYPLGEIFSHITGFVPSTENAKGVYGVEGYFWFDIAGNKGKIQKQESVTGEVLLSSDYRQKNARLGKNIVVTIDSTIQRKVVELLKEGVRRYKAKGGVVIVMDPQTGFIKAMASYPTYNANEYWKVSDYSIYSNKAVSYVYEFGSVQKPLTLAMVLQEKLIQPDFRCNDTGVLQVLDRKIYNWEYKRYGLLDLVGILRYSDNVCAAKVGLRLQAETFIKYLKRLGFGSVQYVGLEEEQTGLIRNAEEWNKVDLAVASFGQMITGTPLQVISAHSAIANEGVRMKPTIVRQIYNDETTIDISPIVASRVFRPEVANYIKQAMYKATLQAGYFSRHVPGYAIAGKTGSAQVPREQGPGYKEDAVNATFVGFAPVKSPKMIMLVLLIEPQKGKLASYTAVPLWADIFKAIKDDLGIKPGD